MATKKGATKGTQKKDAKTPSRAGAKSRRAGARAEAKAVAGDAQASNRSKGKGAERGPKRPTGTAMPGPARDPRLPEPGTVLRKVDRQGRFWAGSMDDAQRHASGALYRIDANRSVTLIDDDYRIANGPAFSPDGRIMYHNDTGRQVTYAFDLDVDGRASNRRVLIEHPPDGGHPDGITVDLEGCIWIALWGGWCVRRFSTSGECLQTVRLPVEQPSSCAFGGPDLDRLFVTSAREDLNEGALSKQPSAGGLFMLDVGVKGIPEIPFAG